MIFAEQISRQKLGELGKVMKEKRSNGGKKYSMSLRSLAIKVERDAR